MYTPLNLKTCADVLSAQPGSLSEETILFAKLGAITHFRAEEDPADLPVLLKLLDDPIPAIREMSAGAIPHIHKQLTSRRRLVAAFRPVPLTVSWLAGLPQQFSGEFLCQLLAIASFNADGYVRQEAIRMLATANHPFAIRFLLYRLNDPVNHNREAAAAAIGHYLKPRFYAGLVQQLPLIDRIKSFRKPDMMQVYRRITIFFANTRLSPALWQLVQQDYKLRILLLDIHVNRWGVTPLIMQLVLEDRDFRVRKSIIESMGMSDMMTGDATKEHIYERLLADDCAQVRLYALLCADDEEIPGITFHDFLCDNNRHVRKLAGDITRLDQAPKIDYYHTRLSEGKLVPGVLLGLADCSDFEIDLFMSSQSSADLRIVEAGLVAMARIDGHYAARAAANRLFTASGSLRKACIKIISRNYKENIHHQLVELYDRGDVAQRKTIVKVFGRAKNWRVLPNLLAAVLDPDEDISWYARWCTIKWMRDPRSKNTLPSRSVLLCIRSWVVKIGSTGSSYKCEALLYYAEFENELSKFYKELSARTGV